MDAELRMLERAVEEAKGRLREARWRRMPEPIRAYTFRMAGSGAPVAFTDLFGARRDLLLVLNMGQRCNYCTLWADGFAGLYHHIADRAAFVVASPDEPAIAGAFTAARRWPFPVVSLAGTTFASDLGFAQADGGIIPGICGFARNDDGSVVRTGRSEQLGPGDDYCPVWPMFDLLREGSNSWEPKYHYLYQTLEQKDGRSQA